MSNTFGWIEAYEAIATALLDYEDRQDELAAIASRILGEPFDKMDPLTFFSMFNGKLRKFDKRSDAVRSVAEEMGLDVPIPKTFEGLPVTDPRRWRFWGPEEGMIEDNWRVFEAALTYAKQPSDESRSAFVHWFDTVRNHKNIGDATLTMALYWARPKCYLPLDKNTRDYLRNRYGISANQPTSGNDYLNIIEAVRKTTDTPFCGISFAAWELGGWIPAPSEYDPKISTESWMNLLSDKSVATPNALKTLACLLSSKDGATCTALAQRYGESKNFYNTNISTLGMKASKALSIEPRIVDGETRYWPIPCIGALAAKEEPGWFTWKLRPELAKALEQIDLPDVNALATQNAEKERSTMPSADNPTYPKNIILYGPPGTGKTYQSKAYAVAICDKRSIDDVLGEMTASEGEKAIYARYRELEKQERIGFVTFHQSYSYEDFIEGMRPEFDEESNVMRYPVKNGAFLEFCKKADPEVREIVTKRGIPYFEDNQQPKIWKLGLSIDEIPNLYAECKKANCVRIGWDIGKPDDYEDKPADILSQSNKKVIHYFQDEIQRGDFLAVPVPGADVVSIAVVTGEFEWNDKQSIAKRTRKVTWLGDIDKKAFKRLNGGYGLTLQTIYPLARVNLGELLEALGLGTDDESAPVTKQNDEPYVFVIDEINRGNVSQVFGELISLIESSKRKGEPEELSVRLPYSHDAFSVPSNVYIIGTMNTADRSIAFMDTALRRRFSFVEVMPDPDLLEGLEVEGIDIAAMLRTMNYRIEALLEREHTLGHAILLPVKNDPTVQALAKIFQDNIVPLLQEYFYDDYGKIQSVLGAAGNDFLEERDAQSVFWQGDKRDYSHLTSYKLKAIPIDPAAYQRIYQQAQD